MSVMYESLMEGLMENLRDLRLYGKRQVKKTLIENIPVKDKAEIENNPHCVMKGADYADGHDSR